VTPAFDKVRQLLKQLPGMGHRSAERIALHLLVERPARLAPVLEAFDVPKRVVCVARRDTTNTALHAFVLLNGTQFVEAARVLAEDLLRATAGRPEALPALAFRRVLGRDPDAVESGILLRLHREQVAHYTREPGDADCYLTHGSRPADPALPPVEVAAARCPCESTATAPTVPVRSGGSPVGGGSQSVPRLPLP
jgi:hypothetical protein